MVPPVSLTTSPECRACRRRSLTIQLSSTRKNTATPRHSHLNMMRSSSACLDQLPLDPIRPGVDHRSRADVGRLAGAGVDMATDDELRPGSLHRLAHRDATQALAAR